MKATRQEVNNRNKALLFSIIFHIIILLLLFFFRYAGQTEIPSPPIFGLGMEGDMFGTDTKDGGGKPIPIEEIVQETGSKEDDVYTDDKSDLPQHNNKPQKKQTTTSTQKSTSDNNKNKAGGKKKGNGGVGQDFNLAGYEWEEEPKWKLVNSEGQEGEILFAIQVDEDGYVLRVEVKQSTVSNKIALRYRDAIASQASFRATTGVAKGASGTIRIKITSK